MGKVLREIENQSICPCVTTWCKKCYKISLITSTQDAFPCPSAHHAHMITLWRKMITPPRIVIKREEKDEDQDVKIKLEDD